MEATKAHEAQWKKYSEVYLNMFNVTRDSHFKARHNACERLLRVYCTQT